MDHPFPQMSFGNQQCQPVVPGCFVHPTRPGGTLWGSNVRRSMGIIQIICGGLAVVLNIALICIPSYYVFRLDYVGFGIWTGVFSIVTGCLGIDSRKKRGMVIAYMVNSIIDAVLCVVCFSYAMFGVLYEYWWTLNMALYMTMCIVCSIHMVISIIGASFTCGAMCSANRPQHVIYNTPQPLPQQHVPTPTDTAITS